MPRTPLTITTVAASPFTPPCPYAGHMIEQPGELINNYTGLGILEDASSGTFKAGDYVCIVGGKSRQMTAGDLGTPTYTTGVDVVAGFALADSAGTGTVSRILPVNTRTIYEMNLVAGSLGSTGSSTGATLADVTALIGQIRNLCIVTATDPNGAVTYGTAVHATLQSMCRVVILGAAPARPTYPASTTAYPRVLVRFLETVNATGTFYRNLALDL